MDDLRKEMLKILGYSDKAIDVIAGELHISDMSDPSVHVRHQAGCGDVIMLDLRIDDGIIRDASYRFVGCTGIQASTSGMAEMIIGRHIDDADHIGTMDIVNWLDGLPESAHDCAEAASNALHEAIAAYRSNGRSGA
ncbi:MAG: iron-sulfur cluster assembly scaffold protein [Bacteroidota bacterium]|jgi:NifU-like protein involved in Fe-S cluster formation|nr:iron-sulfur cluster assembly scaffold protein [Bacteroidota bacterium]